jgi:hypothetical protein
MAWFKKVTLKSLEEKTWVLHPDEVEIAVEHLQHAVIDLDLALKDFRKVPFEKEITKSLELCLSIIAKSAIILRVKHIQEPWEVDWDWIEVEAVKIDKNL